MVVGAASSIKWRVWCITLVKLANRTSSLVVTATAWIAKGNNLSFLQCYDTNRGVPLTELHSADASKELLEVCLYDL